VYPAGSPYRDGWRLLYTSPALTVAVEYLDMQFEVRLARADIVADYLFIDRETVRRAQRVSWQHVSPEKLAAVIEFVASDMRGTLQFNPARR
jgi:hypothetical protein